MTSVDEIVRSAYPERAVAAVETPPEGNRKRTRLVTLDDGRPVDGVETLPSHRASEAARRAIADVDDTVEVRERGRR